MSHCEGWVRQQCVLLAVCAALCLVACNHGVRSRFPMPLLQEPLMQPNRQLAPAHIEHCRYIVLNFWAPWCASCRRELTLFEKFAQSHPDMCIVTIMVDTARLEEASPLIHASTHLQFRCMNGRILSFLKASGNASNAVPYTILLDAQGAVLNRRVGAFLSSSDLGDFIAQCSGAHCTMHSFFYDFFL